MTHTQRRKESLTVELKSDRARLSDRDLVDAVVCLANADGGSIFLGVEDDGRPTGLHSDRGDVAKLAAMVANRTAPSIRVSISATQEDGVVIAEIRVPKALQMVASTDGVMKRRRIGADGRPECAPMLPGEFSSRLSDLGVLDVSRRPVAGATCSDFDPVERARLRQLVERLRGDQALLGLPDDELDAALCLSIRDGDLRVPSLTGLLLIGRDDSLQRLVPTHEVAFQVLDGEEVRVNEFSRAPLLRVFEWLDTLVKPVNSEQEIQIGLFRVPVPRVDARAYRESIANALCHRDYARMGAVHVRFERETLVVSNPGGFVEGVTADNLLTTEPRPRNPALADALKRIGLVERTGRGVDAIYRGLLHYGRPRPDYSGSTGSSVVLRMAVDAADLGFLRLVLEAEEKRGAALPIDSLIALSLLREQRRVSVDELGDSIQKDRIAAKQTLETLVESGLVEPHGNTNSRSYTLASRVYATLGDRAAYTRQAGFDALQREQMILAYVRQHGSVQRPDVVELCHLTEDQATRLLRRLVDEGKLRPEGDRRWRRYVIPRM